MSAVEPTLEELFRRYAEARDPEALAAVYDRTASRLLAVALHTSSSASLAEDAVQDTFLFVLENPDRWETGRPVLPWLTGILANKLRQPSHRATRSPDPARIDLPHAEGALRAIESDEVLAEIERAIEHLAPTYRSVVLLRLSHHLSPAEIAVVLGRSPSTVRTQLSRGIEMLRRMLPTGVAALLVSSLATTRGLAMMRQAVVERAETAHRLLQAERVARRLASLKALLGGATALVLLAVTALLWPGAADAMPRADASPVSGAEEQFAEGRAPARMPGLGESAGQVDPAPVAREEVALGGRLEVVIHHAGRPVPGAVIHLQPVREGDGVLVHNHSGVRGAWQRVVPTDPLPRHQHRRALTDDSGRCVVSGLDPGRWLVRTLGQAGMAHVGPGTTVRADIDIDIEQSVRTVHGRVITAVGVPVPGATIWACREHIDPVRSVIGRSDAGGYFEVSVLPFTTLGVQHPGHGPVGRTIGRGGAAEQNLEFRLGVRAAALRGSVVDLDGNPVVGAVVQLGHSTDALSPGSVAQLRPLARPSQVVTDAEGRFHAEGLLPGEIWVGARGAGRGSVQLTLALATGSTHEVELVLPGECRVTGRIASPDGVPLAGVVVRCGHGDDLHHCATTTAADGRYRLAGVPVGRSRLQALDYRGGFASRIVTGEPGQEIGWDVTLGDADLDIAGRVMASDGSPFAGGWLVRNTVWRQEVLRLDESGAFRVRVSERQAYAPTTLRVYSADPRGVRGKLVGVPMLIERGVVSGTRGVELRVPATDVNGAWLRGRILDPAGEQPEQPVFLIRQDLGSSWRVRVDPLGVGGRFDSGAIPAGDYLVQVAGEKGKPLGPFTATAGTTTDLGLLRLEPPGSASRAGLVHCPLTFVHPLARSGAGEVEVRIETSSGDLVDERVARWHESGYSTCVPLLPPGDFRVFAATVSGAQGELDLTIDAEEPPLRPIRVVLRSTVSDAGGR